MIEHSVVDRMKTLGISWVIMEFTPSKPGFFQAKSIVFDDAFARSGTMEARTEIGNLLHDEVARILQFLPIPQATFGSGIRARAEASGGITISSMTDADDEPFISQMMVRQADRAVRSVLSSALSDDLFCVLRPLPIVAGSSGHRWQGLISRSGDRAIMITAEIVQAEIIAVDVSFGILYPEPDVIGMEAVRSCLRHLPDAASGVAAGMVMTEGFAAMTSFRLSFARQSPISRVPMGVLMNARTFPFPETFRGDMMRVTSHGAMTVLFMNDSGEIERAARWASPGPKFSD